MRKDPKSILSKETLLDSLLSELAADIGVPEKDLAFGNYAAKRASLRALMNIREPRPISPHLLEWQDELLQRELREKQIVSPGDILPKGKFLLWKGDITQLAVDTIVNAANSKMLGCFVPCHNCIDNAIHSAAGMQLREECHALMQEQGYDEPTGAAKITKAYNLPSRYVVHTVGPIVSDSLTEADERELASCYRSCLDLARDYEDIRSIAFCCISTGVFRFPQKRAAEIAVTTVRDWTKENPSALEQVIFNVFTDADREYYRNLLGI